MADSVQIELEVVAKKALASVEEFTKGAKKSLESIDLQTFISSAADALRIGREAFGAIESAIGASVGAAIEAERETAKLANSMRLVGDFSDQALESVTAFADSLARTTLFSDDQIKAGVALAKSFTLTNEEAKRVTQAAIDLSAVTGDSLESSIEILAKTINGQLGKSLKALAPELANLTKEQLAAGDAVDVIAGKFSGSALAATKTFGGQVSILTKELSELSEEFGKLVTGNDRASTSVSFITEVIRTFSKEISDIRAGRGTFLDRVAERGEAAKNILGEARREAGKFIEESKAFQRIEQSQKVKEDPAIARQIEQQREFLLFQERALAEYESMRVEFARSGLSEVEKINLDAERKIKIIRDAARVKDVEAVRTQEKVIAAIRTDQSGKLAEVQTKIRAEAVAAEQKFEQDRRSFIESASKDPIRQLVNVAFGASVDTKGAIAIGAGLISGITKGLAGAQRFISSALSGIADTLIPGIGGAVGEIVDILGQGPEKTRESVEAFAKAIPTIVENIILSLPVLITALAEKLPPALAKTFPFLATRFAIEIAKNVPTIIRGFVDGLIDGAKQFVQTIIDFFKDGIGAVGGLIPGGVSGSNGGIFEGIPVLGEVGDFLGFAEGGRVPDIAKFEGDRFPARLDAGEQVFSADLTEKLERFLSGQSSQPVQITLNVGQSELARVLFDLNRNGFRTS